MKRLVSRILRQWWLLSRNPDVSSRCHFREGALSCFDFAAGAGVSRGPAADEFEPLTMNETDAVIPANQWIRTILKVLAFERNKRNGRGDARGSADVRSPGTAAGRRMSRLLPTAAIRRTAVVWHRASDRRPGRRSR